MNNKIKIRHFVVFILLTCGVFVSTLLMSAYYNDSGFNYCKYTEVKIIRNNQEIFPTDVNRFSVLKDDKVVLNIDIENMHVDGPKVLHFTTSNASVTAYDNSKVVYELAVDIKNRGEIISEIFPQIVIDRETKSLVVELDVARDSNSFFVTDFTGFDYNESHVYYFIYNTYIWTSAFMILCYIIYVIFVIPFFKYNKNQYFITGVVGLMIFLIFISTMAKTGYYIYFFKETDVWIRINNYINFIIPTVFYAYYGFIVEDTKLINIRKAIFLVNIILSITAVILSIVIPSTYSLISTLFYIIVILEIAFAVYGFKHLSSNKKIDFYETIMFIGLIIFVGAKIFIAVGKNLHLDVVSGTRDILIYVLSSLIFSLLFMYSYILKMVHLFIEKEKDLKKSKNALGNTKIAPHFIFNSLANINEVIYKNPEEASDLLCDFSKYLRLKMDYDYNQNDLTSFKDELDNIMAYVNIIKVSRKFEINLDIKATDFNLPYLSIQPFVENSLKYGIANIKNGFVNIRSLENENYYLIYIEDNGVGFDKDKIKTGIGIKTSVERLNAMVKAEVNINSVINKGTVVEVKIPKIREK